MEGWQYRYFSCIPLAQVPSSRKRGEKPGLLLDHWRSSSTVRWIRLSTTDRDRLLHRTRGIRIVSRRSAPTAGERGRPRTVTR